MGRRRWVEECQSVSIPPIAEVEVRLSAARQAGYTNLSFVEGDLMDPVFVNEQISELKPDTIVHLAAQPSAPYSELDGEHAAYTQKNNNDSTRNLLWSIRENGLADRTHFIETTTTGVYGAPGFDIPEGLLDVTTQGGRDKVPYPGMARSWYHMSKCNDINNLQLSNVQWGLTITDLRTAIVFGTETEDSAKSLDLRTRFDFDFFFGIVVNRFCAMAIGNFPIAIYGKGEQSKPYISLEDCVESIAGAVERPADPGDMRILNQVTKVESVLSLGQTIRREAESLGLDVTLEHVPNPRIENETHRMQIENGAFLDILGDVRCTMAQGIVQALKALLEHRDTLLKYRDRFMKE